MERRLRSALIAALCLVCLLGRSSPASAQNCSKMLQFSKTKKEFAICTDLSFQGATLAWTLDPDNRTLDAAFSGSAPSSSGWVGWGINPTSLTMEGTSSFIAFTATNGSNLLTYKLTTATKGGSPLKSSPIDFEVLDQAVNISGANMIMYVKLKLASNQTNLNHIWNRGSTVNNFQPGPHSYSDLQGKRNINMSSGVVISSGGGVSHQTLKNRHGVINAVGWGILLPLGVMSARYLRPFTDPAWFFVHITFQCIGFALGVAGWATGLTLGNYSVGVVYRKHRTIGIVLFSISTLQIMALLLRPKKDHKVRKYWNVYHHLLGFSIITLAILNIFYGFDILRPQEKWRRAYVGVIGGLGAVSIALEIVTWIVYLQRKRARSGKLDGATRSGGTTGFTNGQEHTQSMMNV